MTSVTGLLAKAPDSDPTLAPVGNGTDVGRIELEHMIRLSCRSVGQVQGLRVQEVQAALGFRRRHGQPGLADTGFDRRGPRCGIKRQDVAQQPLGALAGHRAGPTGFEVKKLRVCALGQHQGQRIERVAAVAPLTAPAL
jgi:hypothetical protein